MVQYKETVKIILNLLFPKLLIYGHKKLALKSSLNRSCAYEPELKIIKDILSKKDIFFDVGANEGIYTYIANDLIDQKNIYCFEPLVKQYHLLKRRFKNAYVYNIALSDEIGKTELRVPFIRGKKFNSRATIENHVHEIDETGYKCFEICTTTLDQFVEENNIKSIGLIKIDVEGHEYHVIRGGAKSIKEFRPIMLIEIEQRHHEYSMFDIINFIKAMDYSGYFISLNELKLCTIEEFSVKKYQLIDNHKTNKYINNFIFIPDNGQKENIVQQISETLCLK